MQYKNQMLSWIKGTTLLDLNYRLKLLLLEKTYITNEAIAGLVPKIKDLRDDYLFCLFNGKIIKFGKR